MATRLTEEEMLEIELRQQINQAVVNKTIAEQLRVAADTPKKEEPKPAKTCDIKQLLTASVLQLLQSCPDNITIRTMVANALNKPIPDDKLTFEQIKDWVEFNQDFSNPKEPSRDHFLIIPITKSGTEIGTCSYEVTTHGSQMFKLPDSVIEQCAEDADGDIEEFWLCLTEYIIDHESVPMDRVGDVETYGYNSSDDLNDNGWEWSRMTDSKSAIRMRVRDISPQLFRTLWGEQ